MGMRPSGLGLRLKSRQDQPPVEEGVGMERWPSGFEEEEEGRWPLLGPAPAGEGLRPFAVVVLAVEEDLRVVSLRRVRVSIGLRLRLRARWRSGLSSSSSSSGAGCGVAASRLRAAERVVGPK
jgi:hypothetical protein